MRMNDEVRRSDLLAEERDGVVVMASQGVWCDVKGCLQD